MSDTLNGQILQESRDKDECITIVAGVLTMADGRKRIVYPQCEYGDGEYYRQTAEFVETCRRDFLLPGETIALTTWLFRPEL